ncbi:MAG: DUF87 domain-containing protein [Candidatus Thorarchaeota archaeon]|nr:DUF87 domain-containing protein [Candidatus Thorarchaeota archaeon]
MTRCKKRRTTHDTSEEAVLRSTWIIEVLWIVTTLISSLYLLLAYLLPLANVTGSLYFQFKFQIEILVCIVPLSLSIIMTFGRFERKEILITIKNDILVFSVDNRLIGISCLDILTVPGSVRIEDRNQPEYDTTFLLALRAGINARVTMSYEIGVQNNEPFLRIFITALGNELDEITSRIRTEATRAEAIFLASFNNIELNQLNNIELRKAVLSHLGKEFRESNRITLDDFPEHQTFLVLEGKPRVMPLYDASQVGTFISTVLKQGYTASLSCVFSRAKPGRERRRLEGEWKSIRAKEKRNEDSLEDQATKKRLLRHYNEIQGKEAWFDVSVALSIVGDNGDHLRQSEEGLLGLFYSIWGGDETIDLRRRKLNRRTAYRMLARRHLKSQRMHVSRLAAFVNTPVQQLPVIAASLLPTFSIPPNQVVDNELIIGKVSFGGHRLNDVGLKIEWLREHIAVLGATGTGKTTLVKQLMAELGAKTDIPWWIFDIKGSEYIDLMNSCRGDIHVLRPGVDSSFVIDLMDSEIDSIERHAHTTFAILKELLRERGTSSELTPAMERLLRSAVLSVARSEQNENSIQALVQKIVELSDKDRVGSMTKDALLNRLEILSREPLGAILAGGSSAIKISDMMEKRVIFDLHHVAMVGGMEAARLLYNLIAKRIFDYALHRGITPGLQHVVVLEEASNLVPESYSRDTAADVTTGESMVMLLRATGQGVVVISTRPNISSNILANTSTKITFRLPYDSSIGSRFMSLDETQERYLRVLKRGHALVILPGTETFEMLTYPFETSLTSEVVPSRISMEHEQPMVSTENEISSHDAIEYKKRLVESEIEEKITKHGTVFDRIGEVGNHVVAFLASRGMATQKQIQALLTTIDFGIEDEDINEMIRDLVSLGTIEREALSLVSGGFVFTLPGCGLEAVKAAIIDYIVNRLGSYYQEQEEKSKGGLDLLIDDKAILILPEHLKASSIEKVLHSIRSRMNVLGNSFAELIVVVRGSVAAAKLREMMDISEDFDVVNVVSAFPSSLDNMIEKLIPRIDQKEVQTKQSCLESSEPESEQIDLIGSIHEMGTATSRAIQMRLWFQLMQDFIDLSDGQVEWSVLLEFINTTAMQSLKGRSTLLNAEEGKRALTELLADEVLIAVRVGSGFDFVDLSEGLWVLNSVVLEGLRNRVLDVIETELKRRRMQVFKGHGYYDFCANGVSYVVFPNQQQLNTLLHLQSDIACRTCKSRQIVCLLTAAEYLEDNVVMPQNMHLFDFSEYVSAVGVS